MKIIPYIHNAKKHPDKQLKAIAKSIKEFGWQQPIVVDKEGTIIVGHGRWFAYEKYKNEFELPEPEIKIASNLTEEQVKAYRLADNKLNESDWNLDLAIPELKELNDKMFVLTGFDRDLLVDVEEDEFDAEQEYNLIEEPQTKEGDLYQLGEHRLLCGDSTKQESFEKLMKGELANMIFTDPPYNVGYDYWGFKGTRKKGFNSKKIFNDKKSPEEYKNFIKNTFTNCYKFTKKSATFYCWLASKMENMVREGIEEATWHISQSIIWLKPNLTLSIGQDYHRIYEPCYFGWKKKEKRFVNKKYSKFTELLILDKNDFNEMLDVWYEKRDLVKNYIHATQKPIRLAERALKYHSKQGDIILEPFNGSGSTMMACEQLKRKCYAIELDPKYVDVAIKRYEQSTGQKSRRIE